jgi:SAM-dependent methyltransferase
MTSNASRPEASGALAPRTTADGSFSLWSERFGEGFHSSSGAYGEALAKFVAPAQLERFAPGSRLRVVDMCVGLGYNSAALIEAAAARGLTLEWFGLELDPRPLPMALAEPSFRRLWQRDTLELLEQLGDQGRWEGRRGRGRWWIGDARRTLPLVATELNAGCDLVLHDAFSPGHCPELWSLEFLTGLGALLKPDGRLLTYCAAAAVRHGLQLAGLQLASIGGTAEPRQRHWCQGTAASPSPLPTSPTGVLRTLSPMEREHLATRAAEPYRDPDGRADARAMTAARQESQRHSSAGSTSAWRRRWGLQGNA